MKRSFVIAVLGLTTTCPVLLGQMVIGNPSSRQTPPSVLDGTAKVVEHYNGSQMLRLVIGLRPPRPDEEEQFLRNLQDKKSPEFHHFLTAEEWNARFAPSVQDEQAVVDWAQAQGLTVTQRYPNRLLVYVEAPAGNIEKALHVTINRYQLGAKSFFSNDREPAIPSNLAGIVQSVGGLNSLQVLHPSNENAKEPVFPEYTPGPAISRTASGGKDADRSKLPKAQKGLKSGGMTPGFTNGNYDPTDLFSSQAYDANALYAEGHCCNPFHNPGGTPPETSIAIATAGTQNGSDFYGFQAQYPYLATHWAGFTYIGGTPSCCDGEGTMDFEWSTAMSNSFGSLYDTSEIYMYDGVDSSFATFNAIYNQMLTDGHARVMSVSWGCAENDCFDSADMDTTHAIFNSMIGQGWTLVGISHDGGATTSCVSHDAVNYPGSDPDVVASGGTTLSLLNFGGPLYNSEVAWSGGPDGCGANDGGSGGGFSVHWGTPYYQSSLGVGSRAVPDVALNADWYNTPQNIFFGGSLSGNGGTSIVAPEVAGFFANENAYLLSLGNICGGGSSPCAPMGNANPYLYDAGRGGAPHFPFYDITSGCNSNDITTLYGLGYYCAGAGYDEVTGWGSVNMLQLAWAINWFSTPALGAPSATFSGPATSQWYNSDQTVSWNVADGAGTGVAGFTQGWDSIPSDPTSEPTPGSGNSFYSGPQFPNATSGWLDFTGSAVSQGCHTVHVESWNNMGVPSGDQTYGPLCYDTVAPTTSASLSPLANGFGWDHSNVQVTLSATDPGAGSTGSGVAATYYLVDANFCFISCPVYGGPISITSEGNHTVHFWSKDVASNFESSHNLAVNIDKTAPHTAAALSGTLSGGIYVSPVTVTLSATDNLSGVASTVYQINGGAVQTYSAPFKVLSLGSDTVTFHSTDKAGNVEATETVSFTVHASTTTTLASSLNPSKSGSSVTFTATVTATGGTPTGAVTFKNSSTTLGTGTLSGGKATFTTSTLSVGSHSMTAVYGGAVNILGGTSAVLTQQVLAITSTSVASSLNPSTFGKAVTFTATVTSTAGTPTGTVTFKNGSSTVGTGTLSSGKAMFTTSTLAVASHSITAVYGGAGNFAASTSPVLTQTVKQAATSTTVVSSLNPSTFSKSVTFTAAVTSTGGTPTGTVTFKNGSTSLGTGTLSGGKATYSTSALAKGSHSITAVYGGSTNFTGSTSTVLTQTVN